MIGEGTVVESGAYIGPDVTLGSGNVIGHNAVLRGNLTIGDNNLIGSGAVIGGSSRQRIRPDSRTPSLGDPNVIIGSNNLVFEHVTIHSPLLSETRVGSWNSIGAHTHVGHDCQLRNHVVISVNCSIGGYVIVADHVNIGLGVGIHNRVAVGAMAMLGLGAAVTRHVRTGATVAGTPAKYLHPNHRGVQRAGFPPAVSAMLTSYLVSRQEPTLEPLAGWAKQFVRDKARWGRTHTPIPW